MWAKTMFLMVFFAVALTSCGGGSGGTNNIIQQEEGADFVTISVDSGAPYTYTETADASSPVSYDPYIWSSITGTTSAKVYIHTYNGSNYSTPRMEISIKGTATGVYNISGGNYMNYMPAGGSAYYSSIYFPGTSGTITITEFGPSGGGQIKGSFDVISTSTSTNTAHLSGSFTITRN